MNLLKIAGTVVAGGAVMVASAVGTLVLLIEHDRRRVVRNAERARAGR